jgi:Bor protein
MRRVLQVATAGLFLAALGCYHATIDTGLAPSTQTVEKSFASSWIDGLVPPSTVETASKCQHGAAKVETQLSFVNMLVGFITFGIYTPMNIKVTCAQAGRASLSPAAPTIGLGANPTPAQIREAIGRAAELSLHERVPVYLEY